MTPLPDFRSPARLGAAVVAASALTLGLGSAASAAVAQTGLASVADGVLTVTGTNRSDQIALRLAVGAPGTLEVDLDDDGSADADFDRATFTTIVVRTGEGDDHFRVDQVNGAFADEALSVEGGNGDDVLNGGDAVEFFSGGNGDDQVDGNRGNDTARLGRGDDSFRWDPGDGSDVVEGDRGSDTLDFNGAAGAEGMRLVPNGARSLFLRDPGTIRMDMDNVERLDLTTLEGVDTVTIADMSGTDMRRADVDLAAATGNPDGVGDVVTVEGTPARDNVEVDASDSRVEVDGLRVETRLRGSEALDRLQVNTFGGHDTVDVDADIDDLITVAADLGDGQT